MAIVLALLVWEVWSSDAVFVVVLVGSAVLMAVVAGSALRRPLEEILAVALVAPLLSGLAFALFLWWAFRGYR